MVIARYHSFPFGPTFDRIFHLSIPDLPKPNRTLNSSSRPEFLNPVVYIKCKNLNDYQRPSAYVYVLLREWDSRGRCSARTFVTARHHQVEGGRAENNRRLLSMGEGCPFVRHVRPVPAQKIDMCI